MNLVIRITAVLFVAPATYYFIYWLPFSLIDVGRDRGGASAVSGLCAVGAGWFVWSTMATAPRGAFSNIFLGAVLLGGVGFTVGFFGPIIFFPEANQGPLVGLFITGPLGFLAGGIVGFGYWFIRDRRLKSDGKSKAI